MVGDICALPARSGHSIKPMSSAWEAAVPPLNYAPRSSDAMDGQASEAILRSHRGRDTSAVEQSSLLSMPLAFTRRPYGEFAVAPGVALNDTRQDGTRAVGAGVLQRRPPVSALSLGAPGAPAAGFYCGFVLVTVGFPRYSGHFR